MASLTPHKLRLIKHGSNVLGARVFVEVGSSCCAEVALGAGYECGAVVGAASPEAPVPSFGGEPEKAARAAVRELGKADVAFFFDPSSRKGWRRAVGAWSGRARYLLVYDERTTAKTLSRVAERFGLEARALWKGAFVLSRERTQGPLSPRRERIVRSVLAPLRPGKLLDLGAGHGRFSELASEMGWEVTAVDARPDRFPNAPTIRWVTSDVRDFKISEDYDCVLILGLLYHLPLADQLDLLTRCSKTFTVLDTHTALREEVREGPYAGKVYVEATEGVGEKDFRRATAASWKNRASFWPTEKDLLRMALDCGFSSVAPVRPNWFTDTERHGGTERTFYLCFP